MRDSGAARDWIDKVVNALSVPYDFLMARLTDLKKDSSTPDFLETYSTQDLLQYQLMTTQAGIWVKEHGGTMSRLARLINGLQASQLASTVRRFLDGELSAAITISTIEIHVTAALGPLLPVPPAPR